MPTDPNCLFCKIASSQIPSLKIYEDDAVFAFLDISPLVTGHTLVIPKHHTATTMDAPPELLAEIAKRLPQLSRAILAATNTKACHILTNNGPEAKQTVPHLHYHIIPRCDGDNFDIPWNSGSLDKTAGTTLANSIKSQLNLQS